MIAAGELQTAEDYFHAAQIFHHGDNINEFERAYALATKAAEMGHRPARWMAAAACDRWLIEQGQPQKYGTQYSDDGERLWLVDVDPATTDDERAAWDVPPLSEALRRAEEVNRKNADRARP
jgi:TPR repeat protein